MGRKIAYSVACCINDAFYSAADSLEGISANARGTLGDAFDSLAGFGREILCCFTTERQTDKESAIILLIICLCKTKQRCESSGGAAYVAASACFFRSPLSLVPGTMSRSMARFSSTLTMVDSKWECVWYGMGELSGGGRGRGWGELFTYYPSCPSFSVRNQDAMTSSFRLKGA